MNKKLLDVLKFILFFSIGLVILSVVYWKQNAAYQAQCATDGIPSHECSLIFKIGSDFTKVSWSWILVVLACFTISNWSRSERWMMLLDSLGYQVKSQNSFWAINLGYFANLGLPRMGEIVRGATLARYENIPVEKTMGTIVVDRIVDVVSLLVVVGLAFALEYDTLFNFLSENIGKGSSGGGLLQNPIVLGILGFGIFSLFILFIFWKKILQIPFVQKILGVAKGFWEGIKSIKDVKNPFSFILHSINIWLMYYLMAYFCFKAFPPTENLSPIVALMVYVFGAFGVVIPSPGGMGTYHALVVAALSIYGINGADAFSFANIFFFSVNIFYCIFLGIVALIILPQINKKTVQENQ
jgi:glycosyltransferase 2 family protein